MAGGAGSLYEDDEGGGGIIADINVTPLVDITLVLLIIFMVTARFIVNRAIPGVEVPKAATGVAVNSTLSVTLDRSRTLYVNGKKAGDAKEAQEYLRRALAANPDVQAVITSDGQVPFDDFVGVVDMLRTVGIKKYALAVAHKPQG